MSNRNETARIDARTAGKTAKNNSTRKSGRVLSADDCMEFFHAMSAYHRYVIRTEARSRGLTVLQYLRREVPALIEEGRQAIQEKNCGRVAA